MLWPADPVASLSHGLGAIGFAILTPALLRRARGERGQLVSLAVFALTAVALLGASTAFHAVSRESAASGVLQRIDHAAIFGLIAGTFTPIHQILFTGILRWGMIALVWSLAVSGIVLKVVFFASVPEWLGVSLYVAMGWIGGVSMIAIWRLRGPRCALLVWGGISYTLGAVIELIGWPAKGSGPVTAHEIFHIAVLVGLGCHWAFIARIAGSEPIVRISARGLSTGLHPVPTVRAEALGAFVRTGVNEKAPVD